MEIKNESKVDGLYLAFGKELKDTFIMDYLEPSFGKIIWNPIFIPCPFIWKDFYDVAIIKTQNQWNIFLKFSSLHKNIDKLGVEYKIGLAMEKYWLPVAKPLYLNLEYTQIPPIAIYQALDWRELTKSDIDEEKIIIKVTKLLQKCHSIIDTENEIPSLKWDNFKEKMEKYFKETFESFSSTIEKYPIKDKFDISKIENKFQKLLSLSNYDSENVICKNDIHPWNWFLNNNWDIILIDNESTIMAPAIFDIYKAYRDLFIWKKQREIFENNYWADEIKKHTDKNIFKILDLITWMEIVRSYLKSSNKSIGYKKRGLDLIANGLN